MDREQSHSKGQYWSEQRVAAASREQGLGHSPYTACFFPPCRPQVKNHLCWASRQVWLKILSLLTASSEQAARPARMETCYLFPSPESHGGRAWCSAHRDMLSMSGRHADTSSHVDPGQGSSSQMNCNAGEQRRQWATKHWRADPTVALTSHSRIYTARKRKTGFVRWHFTYTAYFKNSFSLTKFNSMEKERKKLR